MDENAKRIQREIARDKIQIILSSIAVAVLIIMELYIMINFKSNFMAMAAGILLMIVALFFLISAIMDMSLKQKDMEQEKYEEIYNAQKASYLVIKKSFDEMEQRLRNIEENSSLPAEDIINAQKAVAKVTISRSKENTDALMNSNDELINQLVNIQEKLETNNSQIIEKQQSLLKESNFDIQQKIAALTSQISNIEGRMQNGMPVVMAQAVPPVAPAPAMAETPIVEQMPVMEEAPVAEEMPVMEEIPEQATEEAAVDDLGLDLDAAVEEAAIEEAPAEEIAAEVTEEAPMVEMPAMEETPATEEMPVMEEVPVAEEMPVMEEIPEQATEEAAVDDLGLDLDAAVEETTVEETPVEEIAAEIAEEAPMVEMPAMEETPAAEEMPAMEEAPAVEEMPVMEEIPEQAAEESAEAVVDELGLDLDAAVEETAIEEAPAEEIAAEITEEAPMVEMPAMEEAPAAEEMPAMEEVVNEDPGANLDALLEEIGETVEEPEPEPEPEPVAEEEAPADDSIVIPDVGVDLTDPNRVMSPEEIEKLFASI